MIASRLFAKTHRLLVHEDKAITFQVLRDMHLPPFHPCQGMKIPVTDEDISTLPSAAGKKLIRSMIVRKLNCFH